jgi:cytochrome P450
MNHKVRRKLLAELKAAFRDPNTEMKFVELEKLPYLTAMLKELPRLGFPVLGRIPRIVPEGGTDSNGYHIPAGMAVSMSQWIQHRNKTIFPDLMAFEPKRWVSAVGKGEGRTRRLPCCG